MEEEVRRCRAFSKVRSQLQSDISLAYSNFPELPNAFYAYLWLQENLGHTALITIQTAVGQRKSVIETVQQILDKQILEVVLEAGFRDFSNKRSHYYFPFDGDPVFLAEVKQILRDDISDTIKKLLQFREFLEALESRREERRREASLTLRNTNFFFNECGAVGTAIGIRHLGQYETVYRKIEDIPREIIQHMLYVKELFENAANDHMVIGIEWIRNQELERRFDETRHLFKKLGRYSDEYYLFHGTEESNVSR